MALKLETGNLKLGAPAALKNDNLLKKITDFIKNNALIPSEARILVAVSGGPDSVCLLYILHELKEILKIHEIGVFHLNHKLRGKESDRDELFVKELAGSLKCPFYSQSVNVKEYAQGKKLSLEEAAREVRFRTLLESARHYNYSIISLGHNADDQAETVLMRLLRGSGSRGVIGIPCKREEAGISIVRPLLCVSRKNIVTYLKDHTISWRIDRSNTENIHTRNKIRNQLLPLLEKEYNPGIKEVLGRLAMIQEAEYTLIKERAHTQFCSLSRISNNEVRLLIPELIQEPRAIQLEVIRLAIGYANKDLKNITFRHSTDVHVLLSGKTGSYLCLPHLFVQKEYDSLIFTKTLSSGVPLLETALKIPGMSQFLNRGITIITDILDREHLSDKEISQKRPSLKAVSEAFLSGKNIELIEYLDYGKTGKLINIRSRKEGDRYRPLGSPGTKKLKDILIDEKISHHLRESLPVFSNKKDILYLTGHRIAESVKVTDRTKKVLKITVRIGSASGAET